MAHSVPSRWRHLDSDQVGQDDGPQAGHFLIGLMMRDTRGHRGHPVTAEFPIKAIYAGTWSGLARIASFVVSVVIYGPMLLKRRLA
jgi:hypothetical protein